MIFDKHGYVLLEAILFLCMITFFITMLISLIQSFPDEHKIYEEMIENTQVEEVYYE